MIRLKVLFLGSIKERTCRKIFCRQIFFVFFQNSSNYRNPATPYVKGLSHKWPCLFLFSHIYCTTVPMIDFCLELSKLKVLKMLDLQKKFAIDSDNLQVQH